MKPVRGIGRHSSIFLFVIVEFFFMGLVSAKARLVELTPAPNYQLYTKDDYSVLVDGKLNHFPMWIKKGSLGWKTAHRVMIEIDISDSEGMHIGEHIEVSIHVPKGGYAGVDVPHRIDVYGGGNREHYRHLGYLNIISEDYRDEEQHWIKLEVPYLGRAVAVVVQSPGKSIFIDEISIRKTKRPKGFIVLASPTVLSAKSVLRDAGERLKELYLDLYNKRNQETQVQRGLDSKPLLWECDVFGELTGEIPKQAIGRTLSHLNLTKHSFKRHVCFGFYSGSGKNKLLTVLPKNDKNAKLYRLEIVVAENGVLVPDVAIPIESEKGIAIMENSVNYFVLDLSEGDMGSMQLIYGGWVSDVRIFSASATGFSKKNEVEPLAFAWNYSQNLPIWGNKEDALKSLLTAGINVFSIHYYNTPVIPNRRRKDTGSSERFINDIRRYVGKGLILVSSEIYQYYQKIVETGASSVAIKKLKIDYFKWLDSIVEGFRDEGVKYSEWALYLVDEVDPKKYVLYSKLIDWTVKHNRNIQLYSNPSTTERNYNKLAELLKLDLDRINIWQPRLEFAEKYPQIFEGVKKRWMTYHNPPYPPKSANPLLHYRLPAIRSWLIGADGTGVWSFDDSGGSDSTWNDFGGKRAAYSTVYEYKNTVVPSRRWMAFAEGLNDIKNLLTLEKMGCDRNKMIKKIAPITELKMLNTNNVNEVLLNVENECLRDLRNGG